MQGLRYDIVGIVGCGLILPLLAQRAQLPTKGRRQEKSAPRQQKAIRVLPRRGQSAAEMRFPERAPTAYQLSLRQSAAPKRALPEDRVRSLVRRSTDSFAPVPPLEARAERTLNPLPKPNLDPLELPTFVYPADPKLSASVPNRWEVEMPEPRRYDDRKLDTIYAPRR